MANSGGKPGQRGKLVQIEPRLSVTAIKADEWIPIQPGTEGILALSIAHMMIKRSLQQRVVSNQAFGFENWTDANARSTWLQGACPFRIRTQVVSKRTGFLLIPSFVWPGVCIKQPSLPLATGINPFTKWLLLS